jgi:DNA-binding SARP family transcriptional activator
VRLGVLGPLTVTDDGTSYVPRAPKRRQMLALLVTRANEVVPMADCVRELWDTRPPHSAVQTVQTYVMQLRHAVPGALAGRVVTSDSGYRLRAEQGELDAHRFTDLVATAHRATTRADYSTTSAALTAALALWRGPALADVRIGPVLRTRLVGLAELRLSAWERRIEADLRLGRHLVLLDELRTLVGRYPQHENFHAQLMVALYRSGRQSEAVGRYERLRATLAEEQGLSPSPRMRRLHRAVLEGDPLLSVPGGPAPWVTSSGHR